MLPADLMGPYDGRVLDADSDKPVVGALVSCSWAFERGMGLVAPRGTAEFTTRTDERGSYRIPRVTWLPGGLSTRLMRFTLIIYQRGYVAYRSDRIFGDLAARHDFVQRGNQVRLVQWLPDMSHAAHLVFMGGGGAVRRASDWELVLASAELEIIDAPRRPAPRPAAHTLLNATPLMTGDEIRAVTGYRGLFEEKRLQDLERTAFYDSRHFQAAGQSQAFDVALRVWRLGPAALDQFERLRAELPNSREEQLVGDRSFRAHEADIAALVVLARDDGAVVEITCGTSQCKTPEQLTALARLVRGRLKHLTLTAPARQPRGAAPASEPAAPAKPAPSAPTGPGDAPGEEPPFQLRPPGVLKP